MIKHGAFTIEPWSLRETALDLDVLAQTESVFALANGHLGWRANLDEGEPHGLPGTYLNGVYETRPLPVAEPAYGLPESGQSIINVTNGKVIRLFVDDEPFDVRYGTLVSHERMLDFREGVLHRRVQWTSPAGGSVRVTSTRLVSFTQRAVAAIRYEVEPLEGSARIAVQSELLANEQLPTPSGDPRLGAALQDVLTGEFDNARDQAAIVEGDLRVHLPVIVSGAAIAEAGLAGVVGSGLVSAHKNGPRPLDATGARLSSWMCRQAATGTGSTVVSA